MPEQKPTESDQSATSKGEPPPDTAWTQSATVKAANKGSRNTSHGDRPRPPKR